jgi:hypothetical protein
MCLLTSQDSDDDTPDAADPTHQLLDTSGVAVLGQDRHVPPVTQQPRIPQQPRVPFQVRNCGLTI